MIKDLSGDTMVYSHNLEVNYEILNLIKQDFLNIEEVVSNGLRLKLAKHEEGSKLNLTQFLNALKTDTVKKESKPIYVGGITLSDLNLSLRDKTKELQPNKLDFANLNFRIPDFNVTRFSLRSDTISGEILQMRGVETHSNFMITDFNTVFRVSNQSLSVDDLNFRTPTSHVSDSLEFFYNGLDDLGYFQDSVSFILHFDNTVISNEDIRIVTGIKKLNNDISIDGIIWGTVGDFNIEQTRFGYGNSYFVGGVSCFGLPNLSKTFILADFTDSHLIPNDLRPYLGSYTDNLQRMGKIDFTGSFAGFLKDFVARGDFVTDQGSIHSDINIKIPADITNMSYVGNLEFKELNIGSFFKNEIVQVINLKAAVNGKGLKPENAEFDMKALVYNSGLYGYVYDSVEADGTFARNFFDGNFAIKDPNCDMRGEAQLDLRNDKEIVNVNIKIDTFNADKLNLTKRSLSAAGHITTEVNDLSLDNFNGNLKIDSGFVRLGDKHIILDSIRLNATLIDSIRRIELAFPGFESQIKGDFKVSELIKDVPAMASAYTSKLMLSDDTLSRVESGSNYKVDLYAKIKDISPYLDSLKLPVSLSGKTTIDGTFRQSKNSNLFFYVRSDTLEIKNNIFLQPRLELNGSRDLEDGSILTNLIFQSSDQVVAGVPDTKDLLLEGVWYKNTIDLTSEVSQPETESDIRLESTVSLFKDSLIFRMQPSDIKLLDDHWRINPSNKVVISNNKIEIENFEIYDSLESLTIEGVYADSIPTSITVSTEDLKMDKLGLFSKATIAGFLNGEFRMFRSTSKEPFKFDGGFLLRDLQYDNMDIGDVSGTSNWNPNEQSIYSKVEVKHENFNEVIVEGNYYPLRENDQLDFNITFNEADLNLGQPFLEENLSNISGKANGSLQVTGTTNMPKVVGECQIENGGLTVNYLNTSYAIDGKVDFNSDQIKLMDFNLTDRKGSNATMSGTIYHSSFKNLRTEITMRANNFEFLNTTSLDNELYYGSAYGSGTINVTGPLNDLLINASIRTEPNTRFFIPIADATSTSQQDYISFVDFSDTTEVENKEEEFSLSGLTLEFDIDVTPDAYCELIFDIKTGDIIRGRGRGNLKLRLDTDGEFNMFGPLEITEGAYNFTVPNFINKEFDVVPGSRITWYGEPYDAILDLEATYLQRASFEELDNPEERNAEELAIKVPVLVVLELDGSMLSPDIGFDLRLENQSDATPRSTADLAQITSDEQELKRQVISLLFLKRFSPRQSFQLGGGSVGNSVSEFLSSQVSYLVSQIDENLEVEVDLADLNRDAFNTFQLRFAYTFLNGRLKVTRGGDFGSQGQNQTDDNVLNDIVGDWSVEYSLTKDGKLRAKVFSNTDQRIIATEQQNQETGISLRFVHSFNDITELLSLKREEALLRREEEENEKAEDNKAPDSTR
ncbi:translocation/assembly module TamB domain-containing protein [Ekhidna sp.]|uniref:translocation/assembly module TamB domain-containing protein n=1 Tax=Ekhidna sp. TaxID=2608089 RepID=UPI003CCBB260